MNVIHLIGSNKIIFISIQISLQKNYFFSVYYFFIKLNKTYKI